MKENVRSRQQPGQEDIALVVSRNACLGDMPLHLQTRLLRMLSEMEVVPLGEVEPIPLDIQLISATNRNISDLSGNDFFRSDLCFSLSGVTLIRFLARTNRQA